MSYSVDTSALITGWRRHPQDIFPGLWTRLDGLISSGDVLAVREVLFELRAKEDALYEWARERKRMFIELDEQIQSIAREILAKYPGLNKDHKDVCADPFVIALAKRNGRTVVTEERLDTSGTRIPEVCDAFGIPWMDLFGMIRQQRWVF